MDTVKGKQGVTKGCFLVLTERFTRMEIVRKLPDQGAKSVVEQVNQLEYLWGNRFKDVFRSITVDNGVEFSDTSGIETSPDGTHRIDCYYCHAYSSYERGSNENNNRLIRRHAPKGTDLDQYDDKDVVYIQDWINDYPRKIFNWRTSRELFTDQLHALGIYNSPI
nr:MAG: RNaseH [Inoviridae sp.]